jgi:hypothetical protein
MLVLFYFLVDVTNSRKRILLEMLISAQHVTKFLAFYGTSMFMTVFTNNCY